MSQANSSAANATTPKRLGRYELLYTLGSGGMGTVWMARARDARDFERFFVVKTLLAEHADQAEFREMFFDEARIASGINHPNVARIFDLGDDGGTPYLVMEVVDGESLQRIFRALKKRGEMIPPRISLRIIADACGGLHAAHELRDISGQLRDVVHRDISPHNLLVNMAGVTKVIDFGIAKARDRVSSTTTTGQIKGKLRYMSPEQAQGKQIDRRCDIWALGTVLYVLLTGSPPYDGPHDAAVLSAILFGDAHVPLPATIPLSIRAIVDRALERDREKRFATADEMRCAIERTLLELGGPVTSKDMAAFMETNFHDDADSRRRELSAASDVPSSLPQIETFATDATLPGATAASEGPTMVAIYATYDSSVSTAVPPSPRIDPKRTMLVRVGAVAAVAILTAIGVSRLHAAPPVSSSTAIASATVRPPDPLIEDPLATDAQTALPPSTGSARAASSTPTHSAPHTATHAAARPSSPGGVDALERAMDSRH